jgi:uncharacterized repeat protein (TIGR03847 family)
MNSYDFTDPDHFVTGAVGPAGQRIFYLQAREAGQIVSLKLEKQQVAALADYLDRLLEDLPTVQAASAVATLLIEPISPAWTIGGLGVVYNERADRVILIAEELVVEEEPSPDVAPAEARFHLERSQVVGFVAQARAIVAAGRPPCPYCGRPFDPLSGFCPCVN